MLSFAGASYIKLQLASYLAKLAIPELAMEVLLKLRK